VRGLGKVKLGSLSAALAAAFAMGAAGHAAAACQLGKLAELPVTMAGLRPMVTVKINGQEAKFLVDSGMFYSLITEDAVPRYGLKTFAAPFGFYIRGVGGGRQDAKLTRVEEFTYAGVPIKNLEFLVSGHGYGPEGSGIIGQNLLHATEIEYDLANGVIRLFKAVDCNNANLAYWAAGKSVSIISIDEQTPLRSHIIGAAKVDGKSIRVTFDTGSPTSVLSRPAAARAGVRPLSEGVREAGQTSGSAGGGSRRRSPPLRASRSETRRSRTPAFGWPTSTSPRATC